MHSPKYQQDKLYKKYAKTDGAQNCAKSFEIRNNKHKLLWYYTAQAWETSLSRALLERSFKTRKQMFTEMTYKGKYQMWYMPDAKQKELIQWAFFILTSFEACLKLYLDNRVCVSYRVTCCHQTKPYIDHFQSH